MKKQQSSGRKIKKMVLGTVLSASLCLAGAVPALAGHDPGPRPSFAGHHLCYHAPEGQWLSGDFHQHTFYTDGSTSFDFVMEKNNQFGLDWWANSEHGGSRNRDGDGNYWDEISNYDPNPILGKVATSGGHQVMWRWQSLRDFAYPDILESRVTYADRQIFSGLEWNVPDHEHCSVGVVSESMGPLAISAFEFQFDDSDGDTSREGEWTPYGVLAKENDTNEDSIAACSWMQEQYDNGLIDNAWIIFAHIERHGAWSTGGYDIENFRDYNNAAPDICFGFEGAPGHQANHNRGGFGSGASGGGTYGGVGYYSATVGGLWDALLGEGRHWFNYANSDYHRHHSVGGDDFYPGEYQKTYVYAIDSDGDGEYSRNEIANGLRSGNAYFVFGDLINALAFNVTDKRNNQAVMGEDLHIKDRGWQRQPVTVTIKFKSPETNNNTDAVAVDHIDLIAGEITGKIDPDSADYTNATNTTTKVIATFTSKDWKRDREGYNVITYRINHLDSDTYFRLRGSNLAAGTANELDADGNPLLDDSSMLSLDGADEAWADLWFYSNPIFVYLD